MKNKYVEIDFEFSGVAEPKLKMICCSLRLSDVDGVEEYWMLNSDTSELKDRILELHELGYIFLSFGVSAEASSFYSIGLDPTKFKWICLMAEWRCLTNHNHELQYGKHYIDGKVKTIYPPKPKWDKSEKLPSSKLKHSLAECTFKLLDVLIDTDRKDKMRDICIRGNNEEILEYKKEIQEYCTSDLDYLMPLLKKMAGHYKKLLEPKDFKLMFDDMLLRGDTMAHTAVMERHGYPIAYNKLRNFTLQITDILNECAEDINSQFPDMKIFVYNKREGRYSKKEKPIKEWIANSKYADKWELTDTKQYSLSLDAFGEHFKYRHSYPRDNFGAQMLRYLKLKQSLNGFTPKKGKKSFWDSVGSDQRVRAYLNPYGSLTSRYQPPSTSFLFLKPSWFRSLCVPPKGKMIVGIDYKSEEFLISGLFSADMRMIQAYESGDVYLAFAIDSGMVPTGATKAEYPTERQSAKSAVLGISYLMTKYGLSAKMAQDLMREVSEEEAQEYIDLFDETYEDHYNAVQDYLEEFSDKGYDRLHDGWILFGDNENFRSVANFPKQGTGAVILRRAIKLAHDRNLMVVAPLHDACYFEVDLHDWQAVRECCAVMREAFIYPYLGTDMEEKARSIILDVECWSPELEKGTKVMKFPYGDQKISVEDIHVDERAGDEYERFNKYFKKPDWAYL